MGTKGVCFAAFVALAFAAAPARAESEGNGVDGGRHLSAKAYATEAVLLWRKGGGRRWKAD